MLLNIKSILSEADKHRFAVPAFNIGTPQMMKAVLDGCEEKKAPVILAILPAELEFMGDSFMESCKAAAHAAKIPVCIHMDHTRKIEDVYRAVRTGFVSVMFDASHLPFDENIKITKQVVDILHPLGISVEAELGTIGAAGASAEGGSGKITYTDPDDAALFAKETGIDCLAVAIGTAHGIYPEGFIPELKLELLSEIKSKISVPIVLHGGSGYPDHEIAEGVKRGVRKINISSDIKAAFYRQLCKTLNENPKGQEPYLLYPESIAAMKEVISHKIDLFNDAGKAHYYGL